MKKILDNIVEAKKNLIMRKAEEHNKIKKIAEGKINMKQGITKQSINFLKKHWKDGWFHVYCAPLSVMSELKKLGIVNNRSEMGKYFINRESYCKLNLTEEDQLELSPAGN